MSFFFGGGKKVKPQYTGLQTQTSTSNLPVPLVGGKTRIAPNIIWQGDFKAHKKKQKAGKGGPKQVYYEYTASFQLGLCWGPIIDVTRMWKDQSKKDDYADVGMTLFLGTVPQAPWGYMVTKHPTEALGYSGIAHLSVANYDLGQTNTLGQHSFELEALHFNTQVDGAGDADPAVWTEDFLTNDRYGVPISGSILANFMSTGAATTTGDNAYQTYCRAMGFGFSPALSGQEPASTYLDKWAKLTNTAIVWTGYALKYLPYGDETVTAHGVTYIPVTDVRYSLTDSDFISDKGTDPVTFDRVDPADATNAMTITIKNRQNEYNDLPVDWRDQGLIDQYGIRPIDSMDASEICEPDMAAVMVALMGQRKAYIRNTFTFTLPPRFFLLEPMDILEITDARLGFFSVRINEIDEQDDDNFKVIAEEYAGPVGNSGMVGTPTTGNNPINTGVTAGPVNPPIFIQPPPSMTGYEPQIWAAVSGGDGVNFDELWGGAQVWISTDSGTSYNMVGEITAPARMGILRSALPAYGGSNPDVTNTLEVDATMSEAEFFDATAVDAEAGVTVTYIEAEGVNTEEFLSYEDATLVVDFDYDLDTLWRGQFGSTAGAHASGARFARLDEEAVFKYNFPLDMIGETIYVKFVSFNIWNDGLQDIADAVAYPVTISGDYVYGVGVPDLSDVDSSTVTDGPVEWDYDAGTGTYTLVKVPFGFAFGPKAPAVSKNLTVFDPPVAWKVYAGLAGAQGTIVDNDTQSAGAPSAQTDFDIQSPFGSSIGTMRFAASSLTATFIMATDHDIPLGQPMYIICPANLNGITGSITGSIKGTRS